MGLVKYFFIVNQRGSPILVRGFLDEASQSVVELFYQRLISEPPPQPVFRLDGINFAYIVYNSLYFVIATRESMAPNVLLALLKRIPVLITDYTGKCSERTFQKNLALAYEIIDEVLSFGCPQATDSSNLLHLVFNTVPYDLNILPEFIQRSLFPGSGYERPLALPIEQRGKTSNEIYLVIQESVSLTLSPQNQLLRSNISGRGLIKSYLQGLPSVLLQLDPMMTVANRPIPKNLPLKYDDICFAPFVQAQSFDSDRSMTFQPPDGENEIFTYRTTRPIPPPFTFSVVFETVMAKVIVVRISIQSSFPSTIHATDVTTIFQCPIEISSVSCEIPSSLLDSQVPDYDRKSRQAKWTIKNFPGMQEYSVRFRFIFDDGLSGAAETVLGPISLQYQIENYLTSGLSVKNFMASTQGSASPPKKWSRLVSDASCYTINLI